MTDYERGYKDGMAAAALPNIFDNGDKINGYTYSYKTDSEGIPYININCVKAMLSKAADVQPVPQWISVNDRLPENDKEVLVYYQYYWGKGDIAKDYGISKYYDREKWSTLHIPIDSEVLYWQPLPEPPTNKI